MSMPVKKVKNRQTEMMPKISMPFKSWRTCSIIKVLITDGHGWTRICKAGGDSRSAALRPLQRGNSSGVQIDKTTYGVRALKRRKRRAPFASGFFRVHRWLHGFYRFIL